MKNPALISSYTVHKFEKIIRGLPYVTFLLQTYRKIPPPCIHFF